MSRAIRVSRPRKSYKSAEAQRGQRLVLECLEDRRMLAARSFELNSLLPENGGDGTAGFVLNGIDYGTSIYSQSYVSGAGDINGDGFDDLLIGVDENDQGGVYVIFGKANGFAATLERSALDGTNGFAINGIDGRDHVGYSVSGVGDVNGDGFDDLLIGAPQADPDHRSGAGESYVVFGKPAGFDATLELSELDGANGFVIDGIDRMDNSGWSVSGAGDINGDGFEDLLIGAPQADPKGVDAAGETYVVFGKANGFAAHLGLSSLDGTNGFVINGIDTDLSGHSVSGAGDVNGDGFDDLLIGAFWGAPNGMQRAGESYVVFGKAAGFDASLELSSLDGINGFVINGIVADDRSGDSVSGAGDINADGFDDLLIGAYYSDANGNISGESYVVFGKAGGFASSLELSSLDGTNGFALYGESFDYSGDSVSGAGDVNGDGYDDLLIGAWVASANRRRAVGKTYVVYGKAGGFAARLALSSLDGTNGFAINGIDFQDFSGWSVSGGGDINGDGFDDLLIGSSTIRENPNTYSAESYVVFGGDFTEAVTHAGTDGDDVLSGDTEANVMVGGRGNDTLVGNGGADVLRGAEGNDVLAVSDTDFARIVGGNGFDTLRLEGSDLALDLTAIADNRITGIEQIDLVGSGANTLTLDPLEVLNLSDTSNSVIVRCGGGDVVDIGPGWTDEGVQDRGGESFHVYTQGAASVYILRLGKGDFNDDGLYDVADLDLLSAAIAFGHHPISFDLTGDGLVDLDDQNTWLVTAGTLNLPSGIPYPLGDTNLDGRFNSSDLVQVFQRGEYEDGVKGNSTWSDGDWNADGDFDSSDLVLAFQIGLYEVQPQANAIQMAAVDWLFAQDQRDVRTRAFRA